MIRMPAVAYSVGAWSKGVVVCLLIPIIIVTGLLIAWSDDLGVASVPSVEEYTQIQNKDNLHILIVGGGAAGMSAAYTLDYLGINYTLLEASNHTGGRVRDTHDFLDVPIDLGAEWIHTDPRILQDLLLYENDRATVATTVDILNYRPQTYSIYARGDLRRRNYFRFFYQEYKFVNTTWASYFRNFIMPYIEERVVYNAVVNRIEYRSSDNKDGESTNAAAVQVSTVDGQQYTGSHVIVATPVTILQDRDIEFVPNLPSYKWNAIDGVDMVPGSKVWLDLDPEHASFADVEFGGRVVEDEERMFFNAVFRKPSTHRVACYFHVSPDAGAETGGGFKPDAQERQDIDNALAEYVMNYWRKLHGSNPPIKQVLVENWLQEPFIRGAYSWNYDDIDTWALRRPVDQLVYFAGEHMGGDHVATVHGAAITGRIAVRRILNHVVSDQR